MIISEGKICIDYSTKHIRINGKTLKETKLDVYFKWTSKVQFILNTGININIKLLGANIHKYWHGFWNDKGLLSLIPIRSN